MTGSQSALIVQFKIVISYTSYLEKKLNVRSDSPFYFHCPALLAASPNAAAPSCTPFPRVDSAPPIGAPRPPVIPVTMSPPPRPTAPTVPPTKLEVPETVWPTAVVRPLATACPSGVSFCSRS
jgi:hypothetical protein